MSLPHNSGEAIFAAGKATPPLAITGLGVAGLDLEAWVLIVTLIYTVLQIGVLIRKYIKERIAEKADAKAKQLKVEDILVKGVSRGRK